MYKTPHDLGTVNWIPYIQRESCVLAKLVEFVVACPFLRKGLKVDIIVTRKPTAASIVGSRPPKPFEQN